MRGRGIGSARGRATIQRAASGCKAMGSIAPTLTVILSQIAEAEETEEGAGVDSPVVEVKKSQNRFFLAVRSFGSMLYSFISANQSFQRHRRGSRGQALSRCHTSGLFSFSRNL